MTKRPDPVAPADDEARALARSLLQARHAALAYIDAETGAPGISRIAFGLGPDGGMLTLISALAPHHAGLAAQPHCALMLGEPEPKGDPLAHPRLMVRASATFVAPNASDRAALRDHWLEQHPKARVYIDFTDFAFVRFQPISALLNAGFARAFRLMPKDLGQ
jgi:putative heme iron utilization protein